MQFNNLTSTLNNADPEKDSAASAEVGLDVKPQESVGTQNDGANEVAEEMPFDIDRVPPMEQGSFPNTDRKGNPLSTIANVQYLLASYGITARYNVVSKKLLINIPGHSGGPDNFDNVAMSHIFSLASLNGMSSAQLGSYVAVIGDRNQFNPVATWITSKPWDGVDRLQKFCATLVHREDFPVHLKDRMMHRWLISGAAAALKPSGFKARGVLTMQGPQLIGKTTWVSSLVPDTVLREGVIKLDMHLDAGNKDTLITAVSNWIVEIGELDSSLKKDVARLKGFLTSDRDRVRRPYGRVDSEYPRRTVFCATVNENDFLVDSTGNSRFWTIPVTAVNYQHGIDMQQLWAQMAVDFQNGVQWWLTKDEDAQLDLLNKNHRVTSVIRERVLEAIDMNRVGEQNLPALSASQMLMRIGISTPTNPQCKECAAVLREYLGDSKKINNGNKWRIPLAKPEFTPSLNQFTPTASTKVNKPVIDLDEY